MVDRIKPRENTRTGCRSTATISGSTRANFVLPAEVLDQNLYRCTDFFRSHEMARYQPYKELGLQELLELERAKGIEPSYAAWEAAVLPLNYARLCP
jgi:hypothetical protein